MTWEEIDWEILAGLRERFPPGGAGGGPYWTSREDLANYDFTYGERIGWKWDAMLRELDQRHWQPATTSMLDWGCGSGIAGRRVARWLGATHLRVLRAWDHSPLATDFAVEAAQID